MSYCVSRLTGNPIPVLNGDVSYGAYLGKLEVGDSFAAPLDKYKYSSMKSLNYTYSLTFGRRFSCKRNQDDKNLLVITRIE